MITIQEQAVIQYDMLLTAIVRMDMHGGSWDFRSRLRALIQEGMDHRDEEPLNTIFTAVLTWLNTEDEEAIRNA